ncbi:MAG: CNNM domain-containing protein, partial [Pseudomonadales bacterium]
MVHITLFSNFALAKVRPTQLASVADPAGRRARLARHMVSHLDAYLSATQLGITLASLVLGFVAGLWLAPRLEHM